MASDDALLGEVLVARQPIVDADLLVVGYELLFDDHLAGQQDAVADGDLRAAATVLIDGVVALGREITTDGDDAYVEVPTALLEAGTLLDLPQDGLVLEVPRDAEPGPALRTALEQHRAAGFRLLLDAVTPGDARWSLLPYVDLVKIDTTAVGQAEALSLVRELTRDDVPVVAEHVEEPATFDRFVGAGARYFQGFFFTRPRVVRARRPLGLSAAHLRLLRELAADEVDLAKVEELIRSDLTMTDRFLRTVDLVSGWHEVESVRHGLVLMGTRRLHRWVSLLVLASVEQDRPAELLTTASARARYCEELQRARGRPGGLEPFSLGMFSVLGIDGVVDEIVLLDVPVTDEVKAALLGHPGEFRDILDIALSAERADWERLVVLGQGLGLDPSQLARAHHEALRWSARARQSQRTA
ncbi:MAG: EAL and HDOD domain-containing protein [Nitriliruptoraceae bacterium]